MSFRKRRSRTFYANTRIQWGMAQVTLKNIKISSMVINNCKAALSGNGLTKVLRLNKATKRIIAMVATSVINQTTAISVLMG